MRRYKRVIAGTLTSLLLAAVAVRATGEPGSRIEDPRWLGRMARRHRCEQNR